jgi:hypothetical protein
MGGRERNKPAWLRVLCPDGNAAKLEPRRCGTCGRWTIVCKQGVWESYDPGVIQGADDLTCAIILGRQLTRVEWIPPLRQARLVDVCGDAGLSPGSVYLAEHACGVEPISSRPFKPPRQSNHQRQGFGVTATAEQIKEFEQAWNITEDA